MTGGLIADTKLPRWEPDQNVAPEAAGAAVMIPSCPGGSEIKTAMLGQMGMPMGYRIAPVGARSKLGVARSEHDVTVTELLRWERDQNSKPATADRLNDTRLLRWDRDQNA